MRQCLDLNNDNSLVCIQKTCWTSFNIKLVEFSFLHHVSTDMLALSTSTSKVNAKIITGFDRLVGHLKILQKVLSPSWERIPFDILICLINPIPFFLFCETHGHIHGLNKATKTKWIVFEHTSHCLVAPSELTANHDGLILFLCIFPANDVL